MSEKFQNDLHLKAPVFLYIFHFRGEWSFAEEFEEVPRTYDGVAHVDDLRYLFR